MRIRRAVAAAVAVTVVGTGLAAPTEAWFGGGSLDLIFLQPDVNGVLGAPNFGLDGQTYSTAQGSDGTIAMTGAMSDHHDVDQGSGTTFLNPINTSPSMVSDMFLATYDSSGGLKWAYNWGFMGGWGVNIDPSGNVWAVGFLQGGSGSTIDLDPGAGTAIVDGVAFGGYRTVLMSFTAAGAFRTATVWDSTTSAQEVEITFDSAGNPVVPSLLENFNATPDVTRYVAGNSTPVTSTFTAPTRKHVWLEFSGTDGSITSVNRFENGSAIGFKDYTIESIAYGPGDELYISGSFGGTIDFDPGAGTSEVASVGGGNAFLVRLDADGTFGWKFVVPAADSSVNGSMRLLGLGVDSSGNVYAGGFHQFDAVFGSTTLGITDGSGHLASWDSSGTLRWAVTVPGDSIDEVAAADDGVYGLVRKTDAFSSQYVETFAYDTDGTPRWSRELFNTTTHFDLFATGAGVLQAGGSILSGSNIACTASLPTGAGPYVLQLDAYGGAGDSVTPVLGSTLAEIAAGYANSFTVPITSCKLGVVYSITAGSLPAGLTLDPGTGIISGTPTGSATDPYDVTITATSGTGSTSKQYTGALTGGSVPTWPASYNSGSVGTIVDGAATSVTLTANGGPAPSYSITSGSLPFGLTLDPVTGTISGTYAGPTGPYSFTITATNPLGSANLALSGTISSGTAPAWSTPPSLGALAVGGPVTASLAVTSGAPAPTYSITVGALPAGLTLNSASGAVTGTPTTAGAYSFTVRAQNSNGFATQAVSGTVTAPTAPSWSTTPSLGVLAVGSPVTASLAVTGGAPAPTYSITSGALPAGLTLNSASGAVTGTPSTAGAYSFTVTATNSAGSANQVVSGSVQLPTAPSWTTPPSLGTVRVGTPVSASLAVSGGAPSPTYTVTAGALPAGLVLDPATGALTGTPTTVGAYSFTITATNGSGSDSVSLSGTVLPDPGRLPETGGSPLSLVVWASLALALGFVGRILLRPRARA